jgi:hypothetical protein
MLSGRVALLSRIGSDVVEFQLAASRYKTAFYFVAG